MTACALPACTLLARACRRYLMGFGVAGGMALWSNPVKGVLLGPMCLALVSAAYHLHASWVEMEAAGALL